MINVLFVCLGNICRSPMAEAVFQQMVNDAGLASQISVDSAGTGHWHVGEKPHQGTRRVLADHNIPYNGRARQITTSDVSNQDNYIIVMDQSNYNDVLRQFGQHPHLYLLLEFATNTTEQNVPDAYYTGNFDYVYELVTDGCTGLLATIRQENGL
jgi:protein-tyrosine phosphatase